MTRRFKSVLQSTLLAAVVGAVAGLAAADQANPISVPVTPQIISAKQAFRLANPNANFLHTADRVTTVYGEAFSRADSSRQSAEAFRTRHAQVFGADAADLVPISRLEDGNPTLGLMWQPETDTYKFTLLYYTQQRNGWPVFRSELRLLTRNEPGFPLVLARSSLRDLGNFQVPADAANTIISDEAAWNVAREVWKGQAGVEPMINVFHPVENVIWAGYDTNAVAPVLARQFIVQGPPGADGVPQKWLFVVDAFTGAILFTEDQVLHVDVTGTTRGMATAGVGADICDSEVVTPLPYMRVTIGATVAFSDALGDFVIPNAGSSPVTVGALPRGRWFEVKNDESTSPTILSQNVTPPGPVNFLFNAANTSQYERDEVNCYLHANVVRDFTLSYHPTYPTIGTQTEFDVKVNVAGQCNAFYDGTSINFYPPGGGCPSTGFSSVVYHEYGHHLVQVAGSGQGEYGEGMGDVMGILITDDPILGRGFQGNCANGIRNASNSCQANGSCSSCGSEIHACGQLISGCVWSTRQALGVANPATARGIISSLAINSMPLHTGNTIGLDIPVDYVTLDDDDADIGNGSPHYPQIYAGFDAHNLPPPELQILGFTYPDGRPTIVSPSGGNAFRVQVFGLNGVPAANSGMLHYSTGGPFTSVSMTTIGTNLYQAAFPAIPCGTPVRYYVSAQTTLAETINNPSGAPADVFAATSATANPVALTDDLETAMPWTIGAPGDSATTGVWVRADPNGTAAQPEDDHTDAPGANCFFTGQAPPGSGLGVNDVDGGATSLTTPALNFTGATNPRISYWRWYSNTTGGAPATDVFEVQISNNGGASWVAVETVGPGGPENSGGWIYHEFRVTDFVALTSDVRVKFIASDNGEGSLVEAAIDDFRAEWFECGCPADFNGNGSVSPQDIFDFLAAFFTPESLTGDFNGDGSVSPQDIFDFLAAFFTPCP